MTCPLCGDDCRCSEPRALVSAAVCVDPDAPDDSEEQFAASLEAPSAPPPPRYHRIIMPEPEAPEPQFASAAQRQFALAPQPESSTVADSDFWREEVASRLQNYRAKRRRRAGPANSMELDFDRRPQDATAPVASPPSFDSAPACALADEVFSAPLETPAAYQVTPEPQTMVRWDGTVAEPASPDCAEFVPVAAEPPRLPDVWNLIEFPAPEFPRVDELAEPVIQTPRILEAPEIVEQAIPTAMADISLENEDSQLPEDIEIPLQVAPLPQRVFGGLIDLFIVLAATATFAVIVLKLCGNIPLSKAALAVGLLVPCFFWIAFQYLFLVYAGATPGMKSARIALTGFEGEPVGRQRRRARALAMALSSVSLGLGFIWALVDEDTLCWHDRITRTYPIQVTGNR